MTDEVSTVFDEMRRQLIAGGSHRGVMFDLIALWRVAGQPADTPPPGPANIIGAWQYAIRICPECRALWEERLRDSTRKYYAELTEGLPEWAAETKVALVQRQRLAGTFQGQSILPDGSKRS